MALPFSLPMLPVFLPERLPETAWLVLWSSLLPILPILLPESLPVLPESLPERSPIARQSLRALRMEFAWRDMAGDEWVRSRGYERHDGRSW